MEKYIIEGGKRLNGELDIPGGKNAVLPILAATLLSGKESIIHNCPKISDVTTMIEILKHLGCLVIWEKDVLIINSSNLTRYNIPSKMASKMRSSIVLLGALLGKLQKAEISYPGGCPLGDRPIDLHLDSLRKMNAIIVENPNDMNCKTNQLTGTTIHLRFPSVGATQNIILAGVLAKGKTTIYNPAKEPEIINLQNFLNKMGAKVKGSGTDKIIIEGVSKLENVEFSVMPDRIIAGTYLIAAAMNKGEVLLNYIDPSLLSSVILKLQKTGCLITKERNKIFLKAPKQLKAIPCIKTKPYPGFPTDMQAQIMALLSVSQGQSNIHENIFNDRYNHVNELIKLGACIKTHKNIASIKGVKSLKGTTVKAMDLRGGAALVLAGLLAEGKTTITNTSHIQRGYANLISDLTLLGANIYTKT